MDEAERVGGGAVQNPFNDIFYIFICMYIYVYVYIYMCIRLCKIFIDDNHVRSFI
jgi:hypothetical protein